MKPSPSRRCCCVVVLVALAPGAVLAAPAEGERARTWHINQRPVVGSEQAWGPPNGQAPTMLEVTEPQHDPNRQPYKGTVRISIGAVLGTGGLAILGAGIAVATADAFREDRRAMVPLIGAGLVTTAVGWGLFASGILQRKAYKRWQAKRVSFAPDVGRGRGGVTFVLRF